MKCSAGATRTWDNIKWIQSICNLEAIIAFIAFITIFHETVEESLTLDFS